MRVVTGLFVLIALLLVGCVQQSRDKNSLMISADELREMMQSEDDLVIIDIRQPHELRRDGKIVGSRNIPLPELKQRLDDIDETVRVVVYCRTHNRSQVAVEILKREGFEEVHILQNGIKGAPASMIKKP